MADLQAMDGHVLIPARDGATLVFALNWSPVIGSRVDRLARRKAREARATHYVHGGTGAAAVGCARLRGRVGACYAAAQVFARLHSHGAVAGLLPMPDGRMWLAAARNGAVMARGDAVHTDEAAARAALGELDAVHPGLARQAITLTVEDLIAALDPAAALWRVGIPLRHVPVPIQGAALLIILALVLPPAWRAWNGVADVAPAAALPDAAQAWRDAVDRAASAVRVHDPRELARIFATLRRLPTRLQGWSLRSARCRPQSMDWSCVARYARTGPLATNRTLANQVPSPARAAFVSLDEAEITWRVPGHGAPLHPDSVPAAGHTELVVASLLQAVRAAFARVALGAPAPLPVVAPRDPHGAMLPPPADLPRVNRRDIVLHGPLRSFALIADPPGAASWTEVTLDVHPDRAVDVTHSPLMAQLQGVLYERE